jgi:hypothetical protein
MASVRGRDLIDALAFVRENYGVEVLERVLAGLHAEASANFAASIREAGWYPLESLVDYLKTASQVLRVEPVEFCRSEGRFTAQRQRSGFLGPLVASAAMRMRMAPITWRMFYDVGRLEVVGADSPGTAVGRIHDFPATIESCARFLGIWEGIAGSAERAVVAEEARCVRHGDAYCEIRVRDAAML